MQELFDISGKFFVVTGGSRGIGEMIATGLVANGATVLITARRTDELAAVAQRPVSYTHLTLPTIYSV